MCVCEHVATYVMLWLSPCSCLACYDDLLHTMFSACHSGPAGESLVRLVRLWPVDIMLLSVA